LYFSREFFVYFSPPVHIYIFGPLTLRWIQVIFLTWYTEPIFRVSLIFSSPTIPALRHRRFLFFVLDMNCSCSPRMRRRDRIHLVHLRLESISKCHTTFFCLRWHRQVLLLHLDGAVATNLSLPSDWSLPPPLLLWSALVCRACFNDAHAIGGVAHAGGCLLLPSIRLNWVYPTRSVFELVSSGSAWLAVLRLARLVYFELAWSISLLG
jgi:hypothetical protein